MTNNNEYVDTYYDGEGGAPYSAYDESNEAYTNEAHTYYAYGGDENDYDDEKAKEVIDLWYGTLSVGVLTLGLILVVEGMRQNLALRAVGKPFFASVLDGVYRELATLGIVELAIYWIQKYGDGIDKYRKTVFAEVHFLLFYVAILNAFQACILAFACSRVSRRLWVDTEDLDLDHYIEIREEFDNVHKQLYGVENDSSAKKNKSISSSFQYFRQSYEEQTECKLDSCRMCFLGALYTVIHPFLKAKYNKLRIQVRFHELRVHFLQSNKLPLEIKVSDYLVKSQDVVLGHFVHVSHKTWLLLTAICNILYFLMGITIDVSGIAETSGISLSILFFIAMVAFVLVSVLVYYHMESVFKTLMKSNHLWGDESVNNRRNAELADEQRSLFLFEPHIVLYSIKFMQFGYAVAIATIVTYWDYMKADDEFHPTTYLVVTAICYSVFVGVMARVISLYCVATSMGQLVDKERLNEVLSKHRLREAEKRREEAMPAKCPCEKATKRKSEDSNRSLPITCTVGSQRGQLSKGSTLEEGEKIGTRAMLASLVNMDTMSLREILIPKVDSLSKSVSSMPNLGNLSIAEEKRKQDRPYKAEKAASIKDTLKKTKPINTPLLIDAVTVLPQRLPPDTQHPKKTKDGDIYLRGAGDLDSRLSFEETEGGEKHVCIKAGETYTSMGRVTKFFQSPLYIFITHVLGTMVAFFLVGMRVEGFLKAQCLIPLDDHSWDFSLPHSFELLVVWISGFIGVSLMSVLVSSNEQKQNTLTIAAVLDITLCFMCLLMLLEAEILRCCEDSHGVDDLVLEESYNQNQEQCVDNTMECACDKFGYRTYTGIGNLEPFTALIGLRVFRFFVAKKIGQCLSIVDECGRPERPAHEGHGGDAGEKGTAVELWQAAISEHPDLVEKYGEFSGELLQAMLGLKVIESAPGSEIMASRRGLQNGIQP